MEKFKLKYSGLFLKDLENITRYITNKLKNPIAADNLNSSIRVAINKRLQNPLGYEPYISKKSRKSTYYRIYVKNYVIFYIIHNNEMIIKRILHRRRNIKNIV